MKALIATLGIAGGLLAIGGTASAQPWHHPGYYHPAPVVVAPAPYYRPYDPPPVVATPVYRPYAYGYPAPVYRPYPVYPATGLSIGFAQPGFSLGFSTFR